MTRDWSLLSSSGDAEAQERELKQTFGDDVVITRVGRFSLVHLDHPSEDEVARRISEFNPDEYFDDDCPLCRMMREEGGSIVFDEC